MKRFRVFKNGIETNSWTSDFAGADHYEEGFGKPERWVTADQEDVSQALDIREAEATPAVLDEQGQVIASAVFVTEYKLPAEYQILEEDISAAITQDQINQEALAYLAATDWYIIREMDSGEPCPEDIKTERALARARIVR